MVTAVPVSIADRSAIGHTYALVTVPEGDLLVVAFQGEYPPGPDGDGTACVMRGLVSLGREVFDPKGIVLDLRGLDYRDGDLIETVLGEATVGFVEPAVVGFLPMVDDCFDALDPAVEYLRVQLAP